MHTLLRLKHEITSPLPDTYTLYKDLYQKEKYQACLGK